MDLGPSFVPSYQVCYVNISSAILASQDLKLTDEFPDVWLRRL